MLLVDYLLLRSDRSCEIQAIKNSDRPLTLRAWKLQLLKQKYRTSLSEALICVKTDIHRSPRTDEWMRFLFLQAFSRIIESFPTPPEVYFPFRLSVY